MLPPLTPCLATLEVRADSPMVVLFAAENVEWLEAAPGLAAAVGRVGWI